MLQQSESENKENNEMLQSIRIHHPSNQYSIISVEENQSQHNLEDVSSQIVVREDSISDNINPHSCSSEDLINTEADHTSLASCNSINGNREDAEQCTTVPSKSVAMKVHTASISTPSSFEKTISSHEIISHGKCYSTSREYNHGQCGLNNLGNTCFMNSILQCVNNIPPLVKHYCDPRNKSWLSYNNHPVSREFANLVQSMRIYDTVRPAALKSAVSKYAPLFGGYGQQDSHEYLTALLDALHQESLTQTEESDSGERSIITDLFQGQMEYTIKCSAASRCQNVTITTDPFLDIPVFIDEKFTSSPMFKVRFFTMDGCEKIIYFPYSSTHTIQSIIDYLKNTTSYSSRRSIIAMKVSADNKFFARYRLSTILEKINDQLTMFYEIDDSNMNPMTICWILGENLDDTSQISYHPPLLLKLPECNYNEHLRNCLSNHFNSSDLVYDISDDSICDMDITTAFSVSCTTKTILINFDEERIQQLRSHFPTQQKNALRQMQQLSNVTLEQCLINNLSVVERMSSSSTWFCSYCQRNRQLTKENRILSLPPVLIIHLKRFDLESLPPRRKINTFVKYPLELNMTQFLSSATSDNEQIYDLIGVSVHSGSFEGGHYIAYAKTASGWFCFNDSSVNPINETEVISQNAYVLFYLRRA